MKEKALSVKPGQHHIDSRDLLLSAFPSFYDQAQFFSKWLYQCKNFFF